MQLLCYAIIIIIVNNMNTMSQSKTPPHPGYKRLVIVLLLQESVPFVPFVLFVQPLQRYSHHRLLKWLARLKPFIDAYTCPHVIKDRYRFWTGLLLLFRFFSSIENNQKVTPFIIGMMSVLILTLAWSFGGVYKKSWLNLLNASSYLNLAFLSLTEYYSPYYNTTKHVNQEKTTSLKHIMKITSLSIALATFLIVLIYHILKRLKEIGVCRCCVTRLSRARLWQWLSTRYQGWRERRYQRIPQQEEDNDELDYDRNQDIESRFNTILKMVVKMMMLKMIKQKMEIISMILNC